MGGGQADKVFLYGNAGGGARHVSAVLCFGKGMAELFKGGGM